MDVYMDYEEARGIGARKLLSMLQLKHPELLLYEISTEWLKSRKYIAKAKGVNGDICVYWNN